MEYCTYCHTDVPDLVSPYGTCGALYGALVAEDSGEFAATGGRPRRVQCTCGNLAVKAGRCEVCFRAYRTQLARDYKTRNMARMGDYQHQRYLNKKALNAG